MVVHAKNTAFFLGLLVTFAVSRDAMTFAQCPHCGANPSWDAGDSCPTWDGASQSPERNRLCPCKKKRATRDENGPVSHCGMPAPQYPVPFATPRPTVPTYLWYPPMMPHNSLPHYRGTYSYRHAHGLSRTNVSWHPTYFINAADKLHHMIELPR